MSGSRPEPGLFVIWSSAATAESKILASIDDEFETRRVLRVQWTPERVDENFARFYRSQTAPPYSSMFSDQKGRGAFTVVVVVDAAPRYELRTTNDGRVVVNANFLDAKERYRDWTGGGMRVHGTNTAAEGVRDTLLLLGETPTSLLRDAPQAWDGTVELVERDVAGATGWSSLRDIFDVLNNAVTYIVLRNFEELPDEFQLGDHADIDLLTNDYAELIRLLNARPMLGRVPRWGGRFFVRVGGEDVIFDLRFVGDDYYDRAWAQRLLDRRRLLRTGFYAPSEDDYFESLAYHSVVHKREVANDYRERLAQMAADLGRPGWHRSALDEPGLMAALVRTIMERQGFEYVRPRDPTVFFNYAAAGMSHAWLRRKAAGARREALVRGSRVQAPATRAFRIARRELITHMPWLRGIRRQVRQAAPSARHPDVSLSHPADARGLNAVDRGQQ